MTEPPISRRPRVLIIGGSLGGLFAGTLLQAKGWDAHIFERSPRELDSRGGGIVLQPDVIEAFRRAGVGYDSSIGVAARERIYLGPEEDTIVERIPMRQVMTSWGALYNAMRGHFPRERYVQGATFESFEQDGDGVTAHFADGRAERGEMLIGADGSDSTVRRQLLPDVAPLYAGYVAWRGLVDEADLPDSAAAVLSDRFAFYQFPKSHILGYLVPGEHEATAPGQRRYNWVWYRNVDETTELVRVLTDREGRRRAYSVAPGLVAPDVEAEMRDASDRLLPPAFRHVVGATKEPFVQTIVDLAVPRMAFGRVALLGDAAFVPRPHTAASTSKAAANAIALSVVLSSQPNFAAALEGWEPDQLAMGSYLARHGKALGDRLGLSRAQALVDR